MIVLKIEGNKIMRVEYDGEKIEYAIAATPEQAEKAVALMYKGWKLNDERHYTASARLFYQVEQLPGFAWSEARQS